MKQRVLFCGQWHSAANYNLALFSLSRPDHESQKALLVWYFTLLGTFVSRIYKTLTGSSCHPAQRKRVCGITEILSMPKYRLPVMDKRPICLGMTIHLWQSHSVAVRLHRLELLA